MQALESLHKACGAVELAKELLDRSRTVCLGASDAPDQLVVERFTSASKALTAVLEALEARLRGTHLGPAA